ncbi:MAG TPA: tol-pal system protein YbgF [Burkholderiaceae bacterium]|nr:tol-pal system protein YbgF [Burkholderiaceae bacterium]
MRASTPAVRSTPRRGRLSRHFWHAGLLCLALVPAIGQAQLFGDDEARKAIIALRERVDADRRQNEAALARLSQEFARLNDETAAPTRRSLLDLSNQIEGLRQELARQRGQAEQLARDVSELQRQQKDVLVALDERLRQLEPSKISLDGQEFRVKAEERAEYDQAMELVRKGTFDAAVTSFQAFLRKFPTTGYLPSALFWLGNAQYATGAYKDAIESYRRLGQVAPEHARVPESRLAIANCQSELKDVKSARKTLEDLVKSHPQSEAAATARDRLSRMR